MMDHKLVVRTAKNGDVEVASEIICERTKWLASSGTDQWSTRDQKAVFLDAYEAGHVWVVEDTSSTVVGTFSLTADRPEHLPSEDPPSRALYLYKMATLVTASGQGIGRKMVQASAEIAQRQGLDVVRWDAWTTNTALHDYYDALPGVRRIGQIDNWISGQLFELSVPAHVADMSDVEIIMS